jgi:pyridoxamine 5'-phosphate oxidase
LITSGTDFGTDCAVDEYRSINPMVLLRQWLPSPDSPPPLMALATCGQDDYPRVRHVLLSEADDTSVYFHTDSRSAKVAELAARPRAAIALAWPAVRRQVVAHGDVQSVPDDELRQAYSNRTRYLQLLAWLNDNEMAALSTEERRKRWSEFDTAHPELTPPDTWTGFAVELREIMFWRGDADGPSLRTRFTRDHGNWTSEVLPG